MKPVFKKISKFDGRKALCRHVALVNWRSNCMSSATRENATAEGNKTKCS